jgi:HEAT repeat protein
VGLRTRLVSGLVELWLDEKQAARYRALRERIEEAAQALRDSVAEMALAELLIGALRSENAEVRTRAASALRNATAQPQVVSALLAALDDEAEHVRARAASALGNATAQPEVVSALLAALGDEARSVRDCAAEALGNATLTAKVVSALLAALDDEDEGIRARAARSLRQIAQRSGAAPLAGLPEALSAALGLSVLEEVISSWQDPRDHLFEALWAVAPGPQVD